MNQMTIFSRPSQMNQSDKASHPCGKCAFYGQSIWQPVSDGNLPILSQRFKRTELAVNETLFEQGSGNDALYCVSVGLIALRTHHADGSSTLLRLAYPGEIIGFRSFLGDGIHQTEAQALLPSRVCTVPRQTAEHLVAENHSVLSRLAQRCVEEIDRTHARIISTATVPNKQRLSDLLLRLMDEHGEVRELDRRMRLPLSRKDLADLLGVQPETLSRIIGRLEKDGQFTFKGREIRILHEPPMIAAAVS